MTQKNSTVLKSVTRDPEPHSAAGSWPALFREGMFILIMGVALFLTVALVTHHQSDFSSASWQFSKFLKNAGGPIGAVFADIFFQSFGVCAFLFPILLIYSAWFSLYLESRQQDAISIVLVRNIGVWMTLISACALASVLSMIFAPIQGGLLGNIVANTLLIRAGLPGTCILLIASFLTGIIFFVGISWSALISVFFKFLCSGIWNILIKTQVKLLKLGQHCSIFVAKKINFFLIKRPKTALEAVATVKDHQNFKISLKDSGPAIDTRSIKMNLDPSQTILDQVPVVTMPLPTLNKTDAKKQKFSRKQVKVAVMQKTQNAALPSINLLDQAKVDLRMAFSEKALHQMSQAVEQRLRDFGIEVRVVAVRPGPVITRFELDLAPGIKISKVVGLAKDLARSLSVMSVRIVEAIPGKSVIGVELPNEHRAMICLSEVLASEEYQATKVLLPLVLGKDISGVPMVVDLSKMPHLLVAGTTGSGKSVGLNAMLLSLLFRHIPEDLRLIMIDPKMLELAIYDDIPHLLTPVVTDMKDAANALRWCVGEMERRYRLMAACGVRNLAGFNAKIKASNPPMIDPLVSETVAEHTSLQNLPHIVVVIDEFADLMMVVGKKVEQLIARIAQKARAAGIHMILATQRPSVDVITGLIKSNIPTRISFQVSSKIDSRTILDQQGAEQLLGHGDMLYLAPGIGAPTRVHGAFVADHEVHAVTDMLKAQAKPDYLDLVTEAEGMVAEINLDKSSGQSDQDPLYDEVIYFVTQSRKVSVSRVQRRFKIGYNRAARLVEAMETAGIVTAMRENGTREVLAPPPVEV